MNHTMMLIIIIKFQLFIFLCHISVWGLCASGMSLAQTVGFSKSSVIEMINLCCKRAPV